MQIFWIGQSCFKINLAQNNKETVRIIIDPFSEETGLKLPSLEANILLVSHNHCDHNAIAKVKGNPFLIQEMGEYEVKDVFVQGISSFHDDVQGAERGKNIIFTITAQGLNICHLGDLGQKELTDDQLEKIGPVDILMLPIGGIYTIDGKQAQGIIAQIEPKIAIPMHYSLPKLKIKLETLDGFLKAIGQKKIEAQKKLKIQKKDLLIEKTEIRILEPCC